MWYYFYAVETADVTNIYLNSALIWRQIRHFAANTKISDKKRGRDAFEGGLWDTELCRIKKD